jgi:hypothetical protein
MDVGDSLLLEPLPYSWGCDGMVCKAPATDTTDDVRLRVTVTT